MKHILSRSKMTESMPLENKKGAKFKKAVFHKGEITDLEDEDYNFLKEKPAFKFLINEGTFNLVSKQAKGPAEKSKIEIAIDDLLEKQAKKSLSKRQEAKLVELKAKLENEKERQGK